MTQYTTNYNIPYHSSGDIVAASSSKELAESIDSGLQSVKTYVDNNSSSGLITTDKLMDGCVTQSKLDLVLQNKLGILDPSQITSADQFMQLYNASDTTSQKTLITNMLSTSIPWGEIGSLVYQLDASTLSPLVGKVKNANVEGTGSIRLRVAGIDAYDKSDGSGKARLVLDTIDCPAQTVGQKDQYYNYSNPYNYVMSTFPTVLESDLASVVKEVNVKGYEQNQGGYSTYKYKFWVPSTYETGSGGSNASFDPVLDYYSSDAGIYSSKHKKYFNGKNVAYAVRSFQRVYYRANNSLSEYSMNANVKYATPVLFCI